MNVEKINARDVFKNDNQGYIFGLQEVSDTIGYIEWFKTEEEREKAIKINKFKIIN